MNSRVIFIYSIITQIYSGYRRSWQAPCLFGHDCRVGCKIPPQVGSRCGMTKANWQQVGDHLYSTIKFDFIVIFFPVCGANSQHQRDNAVEQNAFTYDQNLLLNQLPLCRLKNGKTESSVLPNIGPLALLLHLCFCLDLNVELKAPTVQKQVQNHTFISG